MTQTFAHYTARARVGSYPFIDEDLARSTWHRLRARFSDALAASLMPNHLHLIAPDEGRVGARRLARVLAGTTRQATTRFGGWQRVPDPKPLRSADKLRRNVRYVWLNPCRPWRFRGATVQLVDDPLRWPWSTLRDVVGAQVDPWTPAHRVAQAFGWNGDDLPERLHRYATGDEHASASAHRFPTSPPPSELPDRQLHHILDAALAATRRAPEALQQRTPARWVAVGLAYRQGWRMPVRLGRQLHMRPTSVSQLAARLGPETLEPAARCLDARLHGWTVKRIIDALPRR